MSTALCVGLVLFAGLASGRAARPHGAANIAVATTCPNFLILEGIEDWRGFHGEILKKPIQWQDGYIIPPTAPGLGVELDEDVARAHPYTGTALHLDMTHHPILP